LPDRRRAAMRCRKQISPLVHISAGSRSITAVTADGRLLVWGDNYSGQLGLGNSPADPSVPLYPGVYFPTVLPFKNVSRCSGVQVGSNHTIICAK
jgi:alpha-tubulin suppressor-like RCC1 family protein